jgi:hypothetical protein
VKVKVVVLCEVLTFTSLNLRCTCWCVVNEQNHYRNSEQSPPPREGGRHLTNATGSTNLTEGTTGSTGSTCSTGSTTGSGRHASQFRSQAYSSVQIGTVLCIYTDNAS